VEREEKRSKKNGNQKIAESRLFLAWHKYGGVESGVLCVGRDGCFSRLNKIDSPLPPSLLLPWDPLHLRHNNAIILGGDSLFGKKLNFY
jgi:hypothetical protein